MTSGYSSVGLGMGDGGYCLDLIDKNNIHYNERQEIIQAHHIDETTIPDYSNLEKYITMAVYYIHKNTLIFFEYFLYLIWGFFQDTISVEQAGVELGQAPYKIGYLGKLISIL